MESSFNLKLYCPLCPLDDYQHLSHFLMALGINQSTMRKFLSKKELNQLVLKQEIKLLPLDLIHHGQINCQYQGPAISILFEDENFLVLDKPSGVHCHPLTYSDQCNCLSFLRQEKKWSVLEIEKTKMERGLLYRLDRDTSGVLVAIKNPFAHQELRKKINQVEVNKIYCAVVQGHLSQEGPIINSIDDTGRKVRIKDIVSKGRQAHLEIQESKYFAKSDATLVKVKLFTGVRHQIRVQLAHLGHPIIGDSIYSRPQTNSKGRLLLHAFNYSLLWKGEKYIWSSPLPQEFRDLR